MYAEREGSAAAPTAGLHFTPELLAGLDVERVTLHVGLDTFRPVTADDLADHPIHSERYEVAPESWERIRAAERVLAVGTTTVRVLESLALGAPLAGRTEPRQCLKPIRSYSVADASVASSGSSASTGSTST